MYAARSYDVGETVTKNPFEFGRELGSAELVDRVEEVATVVRVLEEAGRLFLIGPRRYGKTSILRSAAERAESEGIVVLRYNAEAYPTLQLFGQALVAEAAKKLTGSVERAGAKLRRFFGSLRPEVTYHPLDQSYRIGLTAAADGFVTEAALLATVLDGLDRMAADSGRKVAVIIDEFQQVVEIEGVAAERQIRAAVQKHQHVGYVFAGSKTNLLTEMTGDATRPFYRLGARYFVGPVPREDFEPFLRRGFEKAGLKVKEGAIKRILDLSEDVPYNVQRLAHECWSELRDSGRGAVTESGVQKVLEKLVSRDDPFYTQMWNRLTRIQQKALLALVEEGGTGLYTRSTLHTYSLALSSMRTALEALVKTGLAREEEARGTVRLRLEDPFLAAWLRLFVARP